MRKGVVVLVMVAAGFIAGQAQGQNLTCTGTVFNDVNSVTQPLFCGRIERFFTFGITAGCSANPPLFCPDSFVTRAQMAVFVTKTVDKAKPPRVALVAQIGGDYATPLDAMEQLAKWCGTPSPTNPCLVKVLPGVYDIGSESLQMQQYVDIEGSGEGVTTITAAIESGTAGTLIGASHAEVRFLTVGNRGMESGGSIAIYNNAASPRITNVTAQATHKCQQPRCSGGSGYGIYNTNNSYPVIRHVTVNVEEPLVCFPPPVGCTGGGTATGIYYSNDTTLPEASIDDSAISCHGFETIGVHNVNRGIVKVAHSRIAVGGASESQSHPIVNGDTAKTYIANTEISGGAMQGTGITCAGVYDENYTFYANGCP